MGCPIRGQSDGWARLMGSAGQASGMPPQRNRPSAILLSRPWPYVSVISLLASGWLANGGPYISQMAISKPCDQQRCEHTAATNRLHSHVALLLPCHTAVCEESQVHHHYRNTWICKSYLPSIQPNPVLQCRLVYSMHTCLSGLMAHIHQTAILFEFASWMGGVRPLSDA